MGSHRVGHDWSDLAAAAVGHSRHVGLQGMQDPHALLQKAAYLRL